jgi:hypothetical protein
MSSTLSTFQFDPSAMAGATGNTLSTGGFDLSGGGGSVFNPYTGGAGTGSATTGPSNTAWSDRLSKALGELGKSNLANQPASSGGTMSNASAASPVGQGRGPSLDTLVQLLQQRYQALYPGGGSSKGLLGV